MIIRRKKNLYRISEIRDRSKPTLIFTNGKFDLCHYGHIKHLTNLKHIAAADTKGFYKSEDFILFVAVNSDSSYYQYTGTLPAVEEMDRLVSLDNLEFIDYTFLMQDSNPSELLTLLKPNYYIKGPDRGTPEQWPEWNLLKELNKEFTIKCLVDPTKGSMRSSEIKRNIKGE